MKRSITNSPLFTIENVKVFNKGQGELLFGKKEISIPCGMVFFIGKSGSGKSILLALLGLLLDFKKGKIVYFSSEGQKYYGTLRNKRRFRKKHFSYVFQNDHLRGDLSVEENIMAARFIKGEYIKADNMLAKLDLGNFENRNPGNLSGGERIRVALARGLYCLPNMHGGVLFADEPTASLDIFQTKKVMDLFKETSEKDGHSMLIATHHLKIAKDYAHYFVILKKVDNRKIFVKIVKNEDSIKEMDLEAML